MVRAPCCEKMGLKKGPWSPEEDHVLICYIQKHGHENWRALPKQAGLLRCGKSCRLRWMNYLRPDIKRGNFTREEEDAIIKLHEMLGNRWSAIAARLPGRTDNEIKNVWHTHLKKRLKENQQETKPKCKKNLSAAPKSEPESSDTFKIDSIKSEGVDGPHNYAQALSPQTSSSDLSTLTEASFRTEDHMNNSNGVSLEDSSMETSFPQIDESFWSDEADFPAVTDESNLQIPADFSSVIENNGLSIDDGMDFWYDLYISSGELPELPEF